MTTRRLLIVLLILATAGFTQQRSRSSAQRRATGGGAASYVASSDWTSSMVALWEFESPEGTGSTADNSQGTAANDLTDTNNATRSSTNVVEGSQALGLASASTQLLSCATATCTGLSITNADATWGCLDVYRSTAATQYVMHAYAATHGYRLKLNSTTMACEVGRGSTKTSTGTTTLSTATHYSALCVWDHTAGDELWATLNGAINSTATNADGYDSVGVLAFILGSSGTGQYFNGQLDECLEDNAAWTDAEACHASNCGVDGKYCMCDGTDPTTYLACSTNTDCRPSGSGNTTAICLSSTCKGRGRCAGAMGNCNVAAPS